MKKLFDSYNSQKNVALEEKGIQGLTNINENKAQESSNWDTVGSKNKNKKFGCLTDVAKTLKA
ncbi:hypothetical protein TPHA_0B02360 [Tetrapisispora phaffii CBS 4417]|uniref:Uncharacterized protein n=1 Tax=Tetrapisispora phaffii (strain ATCC 24235 / CBS 4417 / NBRC 1672 / NRRL Y-8282 / UCD 70-5) TaxID=1071381 RepID=G8BPH8_TETPH|nr:hypothetical protein TPHA_0B02360 [Tetrapisispora phaffii CBS 4417]CCE61909.1 hypothetical protein TPHA_0B02360 [Tetrapisispora phaffii CBS 4417]